MSEVSGDFRFERSGDGLILRADGVALGRPVTLESAADALVEMADWFCRAGGGKARRMRHLAGTVAMPEGWAVAKPAGTAAPSAPDASKGILGVEFGQIAGDDFATLTMAGRASLGT